VGRLDTFGERRKKKRRFAFEITFVILLVAVGTAGYLGFRPIKTWAAKHYLRVRLEKVVITENQEPDAYEQLTSWHDPSEPLNVLCVGIDKGSNPGETGNFRSDVMLVASIDLINKRIAVVSIPRDTKIQIPGYGTEKINAAHSFGGTKLATQVVKELTGLDIHGFIRVDFQAFQAIVDAIGGVPFALPYDIKDTKVGFLGKGYYEALTGEQALTLVRSRDLPNGDLDRIENQHKFLRALMQKAMSLSDKQAMLDMLDAVLAYLETTLSPDQIMTVAECLVGITVDDVQMATVPGSSPRPAPGGPWYFVNDPVATRALFNNVREYCAVTAPEEAEVTEPAGTVDRTKVSLKILNGTRKTGIAAEAAGVLQAAGYTVTKTANANNRYAITTIYYSTGMKDSAEQVAADLDPGRTFLLDLDEQVTRNWGSQVVVVLGDDY
jgi:LCP family protein required for cell wall assembly